MQLPRKDNFEFSEVPKSADVMALVCDIVYEAALPI